MCGYKKIKIEYIMMAVAFASVVWSIFAGFRISRFQWLFVMGSVIWFLGMCRLLDQNKRNIVVMVVICIIYCMLAHRQLINGFQISCLCASMQYMIHILHACTQTADQWISDHQ